MLDSTNKRPSESDRGKRVWAKQLPGHGKPLTGVLERWDAQNMQMERSGTSHLLEWITITDWGIGDPPADS